MSGDAIVYLDHAATAAQRPAAVAAAMADYLAACGATPGRGGHRLAIEAGRIALRCRQSLARLLAIPGDTGRIAFMHNATHALNTALWGVLRAGDVVVVTAYDHNAVLRPVHRLARERGVEVRHVAGTRAGGLDTDAFARAVGGARLVSLNAASNVLGTRLDIEALTRRAHEAGALVLLDAAQLAGHARLDVARCGADLVAVTGHKALLGPHGTGALWVRPGLDIEPLLTGGTGGDSADPEMPASLPDRLEAGTLNGVGLAGWAAALDWLLARSFDDIERHGAALRDRLHAGLGALRNVHVCSPLTADGLPIVTFTAATVDPATLAARLDREHGVLCRHGLHCAPGAHRLLGTAGSGAVRFSAGWNTTDDDVDHAVSAVADIVGG